MVVKVVVENSSSKEPGLECQQRCLVMTAALVVFGVMDECCCYYENPIELALA